MQTKNVEVSSGGKVVGDADVQIFETIKEAVDFFEAKEPGKSESNVLTLINAQHRANILNAIRVSKTKGTSPFKQLREKAKSDPAVKARLNALIAELGLGGTIS